MARQRILQYAVLVAVLTAVWVSCSVYTMQTVHAVAENTLEESVSAAAERIHADAELHVSAMLQTLANVVYHDPGDGRSQEESWEAAVSALYAQASGNYYLLEGDEILLGELRDTQAVSTEMLRRAREKGHATAYVYGLDGAAGVETVVFLPGSTPHYLVGVEPMEAHAGRMVDMLQLESEYAILFNHEGMQEAALIKIGESSMSLAVSVQNAVQGALDKDVCTILPSNNGGSLEYNVTIPWSHLDGWKIGARVTMNDYLRTQGNMGVMHFLMLLCCIGFAVYCIISDRRAKKESIGGARTDPLTGLWTQGAFEGVVTTHFRRNTTSNHSLVCLDIVAFHTFNTMFDHATGDRLLRVIGDYIHKHFLFGTRINGDLFMILTRLEDGMVEKINKGIKEMIKKEIGEACLQVVDFKFGIYPLLDDTLHFREAFDGALFALRNAKLTPDTYEVLYDFQMKKKFDMQRFIEVHMFQALENQEFMVYMQPKFSLGEATCCGCEALVRWHSEQLGFLSPNQFIPLFEQNGFIAEVDFYMLTKVLDSIQALCDQGVTVFPVSINQSRVTISFPNYLERLEALLSKYTIPRELLEIEVTESALSDRTEEIVNLVNVMREFGLSVAMDDFGTGYSSLNVLRDLSVSVLKIDKEFLREADTSERGRTIIQYIIDMAKALGISTVCEGVETSGQFDFLRDMGCDVAQGYFLSRPIPNDEYEKRYLFKTMVG